MKTQKKPGFFQVHLSHRPNPDIRPGGYWEPPGDSPRVKAVRVLSLADAARMCRAYIERNGLGGGNWSGGQIFNADGQQIAHVSYNGRIWEGVCQPPHVPPEIPGPYTPTDPDLL